MNWEIIAAATPATGLLGLAVWRFARLESAVHHQAKCQRLLVRAITKLSRRLNKHLEGN